jgi:hypothetical protein
MNIVCWLRLKIGMAHLLQIFDISVIINSEIRHQQSAIKIYCPSDEAGRTSFESLA